MFNQSLFPSILLQVKEPNESIYACECTPDSVQAETELPVEHTRIYRHYSLSKKIEMNEH